MNTIIARIREEKSLPGDDLKFDFIEELVDRIDDLGLIKRKASTDDAVLIKQFISALTDMLGSAGVELLHSDIWNPEIQRALSKTPTEAISEPTIDSFGSTGYSRHSLLIRKQEVTLSIPMQTNTIS